MRFDFCRVDILRLKMSKHVTVPNYMKFIIASTSGMGATSVTYPFDVVKFRMQMSGEGRTRKEHKYAWYYAKDIIKNEGFLGLYQGLSASILRQATYTGSRMGIYNVLVDFYTKEDGTPASFLEKFFSGIVGGAVGGLVAVPTDVAMTRMALDGKRPTHLRRNYKCATFAITTIRREEGFFALFRGTVPTVLRAIVVNVAQFVSYTQTKQFLISNNYMTDSTGCHVISSVSSAFVTTTSLMPMDIAKTRLQNMNMVNGIPEYSGLLDVWTKLITKEGVLSLWKGFSPSFIKNCPQGIVLFLLYENQSRMYKNYVSVK